MTTTTSPHSPLPWTYRWNTEDTGEGLVAACGQYGEGVYCEEELFLWERPEDELEANARLIVRAVNSHEALLGAARIALALIDAPDAPDSGASPIVVLVRQQLRTAIAAAEAQR